ncbi:MAG: hypothetical protein HYW49_11110 [Deltaproteobacteria bacterium]|nr:hypothetical protein [Deltaproteobacteria bacterium]
MGKLLNGSIDYRALRAHFFGDYTVLPERYSPEDQRLSRVRGVQVILQYLDVFHGVDYLNRVLRRLQLCGIMFDDLEKYVSPLVGIDILNNLEKDGFCSEQIKDIGKMTFTVSQSDLGKSLSAQKSPKALYEYLHEALPPYYDMLFQYKLERLAKYGCTVRVIPRAESQDRFCTHAIGDRALCLYKQGVYASFLANLNGQYAEVSESDCLYKGAAFCRYNISWNSAVLLH